MSDRPVLLVTGGSRGIGAAICRFAAERGYDVAVNYQGNAQAAADVVASCGRAGARAVAIQGDMALEKDIEVLLVDADVAKPHVSRILGVENEKGLLDLLVDTQLHANQVILRTDVSGLSVLPAGQRIETATELLASDRMAQVVEQLAAPDGRRIVVFDSPPLLLSTESRVLVSSAGQVVLVVRAEVTAQQAVKDAIAAIGEGKPVSLILNQTSAPPAGGYYGYGSYGDPSIPSRSS